VSGISEEEDESGGCDDDDMTSLMNGYHHHDDVMNSKSVIGGTALTLSQAIARCNSLTDVLFGDTEFLTSSSACNYSCHSDDCDDTNEVILSALSLSLYITISQCATYIHAYINL